MELKRLRKAYVVAKYVCYSIFLQCTLCNALFAAGEHTLEVNVYDKEISGKVSDEEGTGIPGVNVVVKDRNIGTITDVEGNYRLNVPDEVSTLVFSFVGYITQEVNIGNQTTLDIELAPDVASLEEVVVVGYGTQKKINLTGAVDNVNLDKDIGQRPVASLPQMLQGALPNLNISTNNSGGEPGATTNLNIRGTGTITGDGGTPYILLDGLPITVSQMNSINPNDVESISVLKDAASAAIYGSRGAYGVILITTKKGDAGGKGISVDYSSNVAFSAPTILPKMANSLDFAHAYNTASINGGGTAYFTDDEIQDIIDYQNGLKAAQTEPNESGTNWRYWSDGYANNDWFDIMYKDWAPRHQHRLSLNGGSEKTTFYLSGNFFQQFGNLEYGNDKYNRINFTANVRNQATDWLSFDVSSKYSREKRVFPSGGFGTYDKNIIYHQVSRLWPTVPITNADGDIVNSDILRIQKSGDTQEYINNTILQVGTEVEPIKGWVTRFSYNWNLTSSNEEEIRLINLVEMPDGTTTNVGYNNDRIARTFGNTTNQLFNITTRYSTSVGGHTFGGLVGYEQRLQEAQSLYGNRTQFITASLPTLSTSVGEDNVDDALSHFSTQGVFGRINYNFQEKYLVEFNARYDGSSFFREGKRWGFFPSASVGYNIAGEEFWQPIEHVVGSFKLRASWGQLGNHDPDFASLYLERLPASTTSWLIDGSIPTIILPPGLISPSLTWETVTTLDIGLDAALFDNRMEVIFDWYDRTTSDMIGPAEALPSLLGASAPSENNAELRTRGWELILRYRNNVGPIGYHISANLSDNKSQVTKYNNPTNILTTYREGQDLNEIWGYETIGYFETDAAAEGAADQSYFYSRWTAGDIQYADLNDDGVINNGANTTDDPGDRRVIGNSTPRYSYGVNLGANWKGFDLSILVQGVAKRDYMFSSSTNMFWGFRGNEWQNTVMEANLDFWTPENTNAYFPKPYMNGEHNKNTQSQTKYLQDASYMRLKNVQLSYTLPASVIQNIGLTNLQVYFSGENLLTFTDLFENLDPEVLGGAWGSGKIYPLQKVLSVGVILGL